ncbi:ISP domain-containing protein [Venturia nashicola]|uniref:Choline monooxygenase, chloroplastic n=1 Tax=Venturia nashicola TaxID=86259 RepID=A0A4Z1NGS3_9PEZI|nr:ISP domain-containing protein [Venturia nashicola]
MWRLFSSSRPSDTPPKPDPTRGLAASWYRSPELNQLERRAIFHRRWILVTHSLRFAKHGDYISFNIAGLSFFLITDREGNLRGFHNLCRHRAYPIVECRSGTASILSCKYHGWSYSLKGMLSKAPRFDTVEAFDKGQHSLLPVNVFVDSAGFIYVNLQAGEPDVKWEEHFAGVHDQGRMKEFDFGKEFTFDHQWEQHLDSNWKGIIENFNECYHCATSHPLIAGVSDLTKYRVEPTQGRMEHVIVNKDQEDGQFKRSIIYFYPATSISVNNHFMVVQRMLPLTATTSKIEFEVYRHRDATDEQFENMKLFYSTIMEEDKHLCDASQRNLNSGVYINGELHPDKEKGPLHFQRLVRDDVMGHRKLEVEQGRKEIWPAVPKLSGEMASDRLTEEELFCSQLEADNCMSKPELAW